MYKLLNNMGPQSLTNLFTYKDEVTSYNLRNISSSLCLPHPRTSYGHLHRWLLPYQQWPSTSTSTRTNVKFSLGELSATPVSSGALDGSICWFIVKSSSSTPIGLLQLQAFSLTVLPFLQDKHQKLSFQVTPSLFTSNYPVAGPGSVLPASFAPGYLSSASARRFQLLIPPPPTPLCCGSGHPPVASQDSCCDSLRGIY